LHLHTFLMITRVMANFQRVRPRLAMAGAARVAVASICIPVHLSIMMNRTRMMSCFQTMAKHLLRPLTSCTFNSVVNKTANGSAVWLLNVQNALPYHHP